MRPLLLSSPQPALKRGEAAHTFSFNFMIVGSLQFRLSQNVKDRIRPRGGCGEYRIRTDDLLHAMQAL